MKRLIAGNVVFVCLTFEIDDIKMTFSIFWLLGREVGITVACFYRDDLRRTDELRVQDAMATKAIEHLGTG